MIILKKCCILKMDFQCNWGLNYLLCLLVLLSVPYRSFLMQQQTTKQMTSIYSEYEQRKSNYMCDMHLCYSHVLHD